MTDVPNRANTPAQKRILLQVLGICWDKCPQERLGQFVCNAAPATTPFYVEDRPVLEGLLKRCMSEEDGATWLRMFDAAGSP